MISAHAIVTIAVRLDSQIQVFSRGHSTPAIITELKNYTNVIGIVGDILIVRATGIAFGELAVVENFNGGTSLAQVVELRDDEVS